MRHITHDIIYERGFTMMELVVVLALFMLVMGVVVNMFTSIVQSQKKILAEQELLNQVSYAEEYISRAARAAVKDTAGECLFDNELVYPGYLYLLTHYNTELGMYEGIKFITKDNICQEFFLDRFDGLLKEVKNGSLPQAILSAKFNLQQAVFIINGDKQLSGAAAVDARQPRVTMAITVKNQTEGSPDQVFQTTISQRNLNIQE